MCYPMAYGYFLPIKPYFRGDFIYGLKVNIAFNYKPVMHVVSLDRLNIHDKVIVNTYEKNVLSICNLKINSYQFLTPHLVCEKKQE